MKKIITKLIKKESLFLFFFLILFGIGISFVIFILGFRGELKTLEQIYLILFIILAILLVMLVSSAILFLMIVLKIPLFIKKDILEITPEEIIQMSDEKKAVLLKELEDKKNKIQYMIDLAKTKYYKKELDEESFREIIRDHQKRLIEIEIIIKEMKDEIKKLGG